MAVMAKSAELLRTRVRWIPGVYMLADSLSETLGKWNPASLDGEEGEIRP